MTLTLIVALSQIAGSVAVVVTVAVLVVQIRDSTKANRASTQQFIDQGWLEVTRMVAEDTDIARIYRTGMKDFSALDTDDQWRFGALMQIAFSGFQNTYIYGAKTAQTDELLNKRSYWMASQPGPRTWWPRAKRLYDPAFQDFVDGVFATTDNLSPAEPKEPTP